MAQDGNLEERLLLMIFWEYDPSANTWTQKPNIPGTGRLGAFGFSVNTFGYIGGGNNGINCSGGFYNDFYQFDPNTGANGTWTVKPNIPFNHVYGATFSIGSKGYVGSGCTASQSLWEWDQGTSTWTAKTNFPGTGGVKPGSFTVGNRGYFLSVGANTFWEYDPIGDSWTQLCNFLGTSRSGMVGFSVNNVGYITTGYDGAYKKDLWEVQPACGGALPIELLSFTAQWQDKNYQTAKIEWSTATEINNETFEVQRSIDGVNFETIIRKDGAGNSTEPIDYEVLDTAPYRDRPTYYRLKQIDFDGSYSYSQIDVIEPLTQLDIIKLYPNPVVDNFTYEVYSSTTTAVKTTITNNLGQLVYHMESEMAKGVSKHTLAISDLAKGEYIIQINTTSSLHHTARRFVVGKK